MEAGRSGGSPPLNVLYNPTVQKVAPSLEVTAVSVLLVMGLVLRGLRGF